MNGYYKEPLPCFSDHNVWLNLKRQCMDGTLDHGDFPADEYKYFDRLGIIYREYKEGNISKEEVRAQERIILKEYQQAKQIAARSLDVYRQYQENIKRFDDLRIEINKAVTAEDKLRPALRIVGIVTGDVDFARRNLK